MHWAGRIFPPLRYWFRRKLTAVWKVETQQDLENQYSPDLEQEMIEALGKEIAESMDKEIVAQASKEQQLFVNDDWIYRPSTSELIKFYREHRSV